MSIMSELKNVLMKFQTIWKTFVRMLCPWSSTSREAPFTTVPISKKTSMSEVIRIRDLMSCFWG